MNAISDILWPITVVTAPDLAAPLAEEIRQLVSAKISDRPFGIELLATPTEAYRIVCDSLIAGHVYLRLQQGDAATADALYQFVQRIDWSAHLAADGYFSVSATGTTEALRHTGFIATRIKDAIVDQFRARTGQRPSIDTEHPDLRLHCHLTAQGQATLSLELSNGSLHRRGYRQEGGLAPLRETLAAGMLWRARWPKYCAEASPEHPVTLFDPMCGSGTLVIEAALAALGQPPAMRARRLGSRGWLLHDVQAQSAVLANPPPARDPAAFRFIGRDIDTEQIAAARSNAARAGLADRLDFAVADAWQAPCPTTGGESSQGLLISNLPYGERITVQNQRTDQPDWHQLTQAWQAQLQGWHWALLLPEGMGKHWPLRFERSFALDQSGIAVELIRGEFNEKSQRSAQGPLALAARLAQDPIADSLDASAFHNRLQKNLKHLRKYATREGLCCYRLYDADLPEFNAAIDLYQDETGETYIDLQEYRAPNHIDPQLSRARLAAMVRSTLAVLALPADHCVLRQRQRQTGNSQYQRLNEARLEKVVREGGTRLWINLTDYLDTGLFLDHRRVRDRVAELAQGNSLLNLFCYTATASVRAAYRGAASSLSIDLSNTYLDWAERNFALNGIQTGGQHRLLRANVLDWLAKMQHASQTQRFDIIFCDPPSFSNSKAMEGTLDIQRDHPQIIRQCMHLLRPEGIFIFSNNLKGFKLSPELQEEFQINDLSRSTLPTDFERTPNRRSVFEIRHRKA
ncbi:bifunctional 23S rRNA (guanine(2069)-N(7))-methyltransferase RlmK/23S rRNA (guanine(2445)-N(2))-methyltransferase RlmL [Halothiobacillus sp. DCM-1]|uniref:bifunctional 23S rRNA (guanine(2069)-N(7))-methyltransferase RlmK/23S rRNA (guanine(2445)-N(2))-methyltransferase RlmL n=1 Tax=Halothiobacillus sp. DCM-1 TaxID=3112558 RepID=UPI0032490D2D